jgi:hypothetical protein
VLGLDLGQGFTQWPRGVERGIDWVIDLVRDASDELTNRSQPLGFTKRGLRF